MNHTNTQAHYHPQRQPIHDHDHGFFPGFGPPPPHPHAAGPNYYQHPHPSSFDHFPGHGQENMSYQQEFPNPDNFEIRTPPDNGQFFQNQQHHPEEYTARARAPQPHHISDQQTNMTIDCSNSSEVPLLNSCGISESPDLVRNTPHEENVSRPVRICTGIVTSICGDLGFIGPEIFFHVSTVRGEIKPQVGDSVIAKLEAVEGMNFKWNSKDVQVVDECFTKDGVFDCKITQEVIVSYRESGELVQHVTLKPDVHTIPSPPIISGVGAGYYEDGYPRYSRKPRSQTRSPSRNRRGRSRTRSPVFKVRRRIRTRSPVDKMMRRSRTRSPSYRVRRRSSVDRMRRRSRSRSPVYRIKRNRSPVDRVSKRTRSPIRIGKHDLGPSRSPIGNRSSMPGLFDKLLLSPPKKGSRNQRSGKELSHASAQCTSQPRSSSRNSARSPKPCSSRRRRSRSKSQKSRSSKQKELTEAPKMPEESTTVISENVISHKELLVPNPDVEIQIQTHDQSVPGLVDDSVQSYNTKTVHDEIPFLNASVMSETETVRIKIEPPELNPEGETSHPVVNDCPVPAAAVMDSEINIDNGLGVVLIKIEKIEKD